MFSLRVRIGCKLSGAKQKSRCPCWDCGFRAHGFQVFVRRVPIGCELSGAEQDAGFLLRVLGVKVVVFKSFVALCGLYAIL